MFTNMDYDSIRKRYVLKLDFVINELGDLRGLLYDEFDPNPTSLPERVLKRISNNMYEFMKQNARDFNYSCERIETEHETNLAFQDAMMYQLEDFITVGERAFGEHDKLIGGRAYELLRAYGLLDRVRPLSLTKTGVYNDRTVKQ